jgi:hypothetical protein
LTRICIVGALLLGIFIFMAVTGCDKERIVESTEYIHDIEYVELPPDTVLKIDTVFSSDSVIIYSTDTLILYDTVAQVSYIYDTVFSHDTIVTVITDTVQMTQCTPNEYLAVTALQYYSDPLVLDLINQEFGINSGWIFYLSAFQLDVTAQSTNVYDIYGYIDYWTDDWSGFYAIEFYWRLTYISGDPAHPGSWQMSDPPTAAPGFKSGIKIIQDSRQTQPVGR